ncbi:MAG: manganese efflux pump [Bacilli bacterium]|nr:manganese efflux pump [Bacilli bacterium]
MTKILTYTLMGISLSMDAFSLSLSLGMMSPPKDKVKIIIILVGIFHFLMPLLGNIVGEAIQRVGNINGNRITSLIFLSLALQMILTIKKEEKIDLKIKAILLLAFTVSIDSLSVGLAFGLTNEKKLLASFLFMIISSSFTYMGFFLGKKLYQGLEEKATNLGILIMIGMAIKYLI